MSCETKFSVCSDLDGVVSDLNSTAVNYADVFTHNLTGELKIGLPLLNEKMQRAAAEIRAHPGKYGWPFKIGEHEVIVAPAEGDPHIFFYTVLSLVFAEMKNETQSFTPPPFEILHKFHTQAETTAGIHFKPYAIEYVETLQHETNLVFITNSSERSAKYKLGLLLTDSKLSVDNLVVIADARKAELDPDWQRVPESMKIPGLDRSYFLRRGKFGRILERIPGTRRVMIGDNLELDCILAHEVGFDIVLVTSETTPGWELNYAKSNQQRRFASNSLSEILNHIQKL